MHFTRPLTTKWAVEQYKERGLHIPDMTEFMTAEGVSRKGVAKYYVLPPAGMKERLFKAARELEAKDPDLYQPFLLSYPAAFRAKETASATLDWLIEKDSRYSLHVPVDDLFSPKGSRPRIVPIAEVVAKSLIQAADRNGGYFLPGKAFTPRYKFVEKNFSNWMTANGWTRPKKSHDLRALQGCRWYTEQGAEVAQMLLGHKSIQTTCQFYALYTRQPEALEPDW